MPGPKSTFLTCPDCGGDLNLTTDSRPGLHKNLQAIRRRKACQSCGERHTTYELTARDLERLGLQALGKFTSDPRVRDIIAQVALERGIA